MQLSPLMRGLGIGAVCVLVSFAGGCGGSDDSGLTGSAGKDAGSGGASTGGGGAGTGGNAAGGTSSGGSSAGGSSATGGGDTGGSSATGGSGGVAGEPGGGGTGGAAGGSGASGGTSSGGTSSGGTSSGGTSSGGTSSGGTSAGGTNSGGTSSGGTGNGGTGGTTCTPKKWCKDGDADGYGTTSITQSCESPGSGWIQDGSKAQACADCNDENNHVRPFSTFCGATGYPSGGTISFDYNCDGYDVACADFIKAGKCALDPSNPTKCLGSGYLPSPNPSPKNPYCGSDQFQLCTLVTVSPGPGMDGGMGPICQPTVQQYNPITCK